MTERPNIRRMQVPEKGSTRELPFDANKELDQAFWSGIKPELKSLQNTNDWRRVFAIVASLTTIGNSDKFTISPQDWEKIDDYLQKCGADSSEDIRFLARVKTVDPTHDMGITEEKWPKMIDKLESLIRERDWQIVASYAKSLKVLRPQHTILSGENQTHILEELQQHRKNAQWHSFPTLADEICTINPSIDLSITTTDWENMRRELRKYCSEPNWTNAAIHAAEMQTIARSQANIHATEKADTAIPETLEL